MALSRSQPLLRAQEKSTDLVELLLFLRKKAWIIILMTAFITIASGCFSYFVLTPVYQAKTEVLINKYASAENLDGNNGVSLSDIDSNLKLVNTYIVIMKSPRILDVALQNYKDVPLSKLMQQIKIQQVPNSQVISVIVEDSNYKRAAQMANAISETFQKEIVNIMKIDNVQILTKASLDDIPAPVSPQYRLIAIVAFFLSLAGTVGFLFIKQQFDTRISNEREAGQYLQVPILGSFSKIQNSKNMEPSTSLEVSNNQGM